MAWLLAGLLGLVASPQTQRASLKRTGLSTVGCPYGCRPSSKDYVLTRAC